MAAGEEAKLADLAAAGTTAVGGFLAGPLGATALHNGAAMHNQPIDPID